MCSIRQFSAFYSHFLVTSGKMTSLRVTSGHLRLRDVISCHVTASSCELQPCKKWNAQYTWVFGLLQPLPGNFRSNDVTSRSLPVTGGLVTSFPVTGLPPPASYSLVKSETHGICEFSAFYSHFQVTSGHLRSRDVISCHVTASSSEQQPCRMWNAQYTRVSGLLQQLSCDFRSNDVTSWSLPVPSGHVTSFPVMWLPSHASYSVVGSETHRISEFSAYHSHFKVTSAQMRSLAGHFRSPDVTWCHFLPRDCLLRATALWEVKRTVYASFRPSTTTSRWLPVKWRHFRVTAVTWGDVTWFPVTWVPPPASYSLVGSETHSICEFSAFYSDFQVSSGQMTSLPCHCRHLRWLTSFPVMWVPHLAIYSLVRSETHSIRKFSAFYSHFQVTSGQMSSLPGHFWSHEVTWCHFLSRDCLFPWAIAL